MPNLSVLLLLSLSAGMLGLGGCNAALGIDEAHDRDGGQAVTAQAIPLKDCNEPKMDCGSCVEKSQRFAECMGDHFCRKALNHYRECLGTHCSKPECLAGLAKDPIGTTLVDWITTECSSGCVDASPLASMCDLYCACMGQQLPKTGKTCQTVNDSLPWQLSGEPTADTAACKESCKKLDLGSANCRWSHCELATNGESSGHCLHAVSDFFCPTVTVVDPKCTDRFQKNWGCVDNTDCCSNICSGRVCN